MTAALALALLAVAALHGVRALLLRRELRRRGRPVDDLLAHLSPRQRASVVVSDLGVALLWALLAARNAAPDWAPAIGAAVALAVLLAVRNGLAIRSDVRFQADILYAPLERSLAADEARRMHAVLVAALRDPRLGVMAWDGSQRMTVAEGGLYDAAPGTRPDVGADVRAIFHGWSPEAADAFDAVCAGAAERGYVTETPPRLVAPGERRRIYSVRLLAYPPQPGAGSAVIMDVTEEPSAIAAAEAAAAARVAAAEAKALDALAVQTALGRMADPRPHDR